MPVCTKCGTVMHNDDVGKHECLPENIPVKGTEKVMIDKASMDIAISEAKIDVKPIA